MAKSVLKMNDFMFEAVKAEIIKGIKEEQQKEMLESVKQLEKYTYDFSRIYFSSNKYCFGHCRTLAYLFPITDKRMMLRDLLATLIFLNINEDRTNKYLLFVKLT